VFHSLLAEEIRKLSYVIGNRPFSFEVQGGGAGNIEKFSRRTREIESLAAELGISGDDKAKSQLGACTRQRKEGGLSGEEIRAERLHRLNRDELSYHKPQPVQRILPSDAVDLAIEHCFERKSVFLHRRLIATALHSYPPLTGNAYSRRSRLTNPTVSSKTVSRSTSLSRRPLFSAASSSWASWLKPKVLVEPFS